MKPPNVALPEAPGHPVQVLVRHHPDVRVLIVQEGEEHLDGHDEALGCLWAVLDALAEASTIRMEAVVLRIVALKVVLFKIFNC